MGEDPYLRSAIIIIESLTRDNVSLGSNAFKVWKKPRGMGIDPAQAVDLARWGLTGDEHIE